MKKKLNCVFYNAWGESELNTHLSSKLKGYKIKNLNKEFNLDTIDPKTEVLGVFVNSKVDKKIINKLPKLKLIVTMSTGFDHIDLKAAKAKKIPVCNVPTYGENTVAEHSLALMMALSRKLFQSVKRVKEGEYDYHGLRGFDIKGKTIGIIGTGHIGLHLIALLQGFEANIIAFDVRPNKEMAEKYGFTYTTLNKLLSTSDIVSLHLPLFKETHHLINRKNIKKMKKGVNIINTARGGLIETEALVWGLETGHITGLGLDVLEDEKNMQDPEQPIYSEGKESVLRTNLMNHIIVEHPNSIVTPHNAFNSLEALKRIIDTTADNIKSYVDGNIQNKIG